MSKYIYKSNFNFAFNPSSCSDCGGKCCVGESGYVWMNANEIEALANHLNLNVAEFMFNYAKRVGGRYSLIEKKLGRNNYACIFFDLDKKRCSVYSARPSQCRTFPFWESYEKNPKEVVKRCPGIKLTRKHKTIN